MTQGALAEVATAEPLSGQIANMVLQAMQPQLAAHMQAQDNRIEAILTRLLQLEQAAQEPREACQAQQLLHVPRINPPEVYDGKSKQLADQFAQQVEKIVWAQSYLTGLVRQWSAVIMTGMDNLDVNLRRSHWEAWLADFKAAFCTQDQAQDALTRIGQLQQGSKSITDYYTAFFELKGKLGHVDAEGKYVKDRFWKGLNTVAMEALVNTDYQTAEEACDILLRHESKLADLAVHRKGHWHASSPAMASSSASYRFAWAQSGECEEAEEALEGTGGGDSCKDTKVRACGAGTAGDVAGAGRRGIVDCGHTCDGQLGGEL
ncbi:hypothetical protein C0993_006482 [Termitomyces sp. T159_Od127]|nr:hypothetical protein C0993_006482 [Termitomyces sp. T159_Od127]